MKKRTLKWMIRTAFLTTLAMFFAGCEMGLSEITPANVVMRPLEGELSVATLAASNQRLSAVERCACLTGNFASQDLSTTEKEALAFMREEEKLARDVYLELNERWNMPIFEHIARAEQSHMDAILCLIEKYELPDPAGDNGLGVFKNARLQKLYDELTAKGTESLDAALSVGATIEDLDLLDLKQNIDKPEVDNEDVLAVFNELARGSRNHLRAFTGVLKNRNLSYERQYLSQEDFVKIINTERERGGALCGGCSNVGSAGNGNGGRGRGACNGTGFNGFNDGANRKPNGNCMLPNNGNPNGAGLSPNNGSGRNRRGN